MHVFYYPDLLSGPPVLPESEAYHGIRVLRLHKGDMIGITDGLGSFVKAELLDNDITNCMFRILEKHTDDGTLRPKLHVGISPLQHQDRFEWFLEKATELGVDIVTPLLCERTVRPRIKTERMQRIIISAMKQSAGCWLPELRQPLSFRDFFEQQMPEQRFIAHCMDDTRAEFAAVINTEKDAVILIGPEGDFTSAEIEQAISNKFLPVSLGNQRFRTETAGIVACCVFRISQDPRKKSAI